MFPSCCGEDLYNVLSVKPVKQLYAGSIGVGAKPTISTNVRYGIVFCVDGSVGISSMYVKSPETISEVISTYTGTDRVVLGHSGAYSIEIDNRSGASRYVEVFMFEISNG